MAFTQSELAVWAVAATQVDGVRLWSYANTAADNIEAANFFLPAALVPERPIGTTNPVGPVFAVGDVIYVAKAGATVSIAGFYRVSVLTLVNNQVTAFTVAKGLT